MPSLMNFSQARKLVKTTLNLTVELLLPVFDQYYCQRRHLSDPRGDTQPWFG
jgi:hypothetical protein